MLKDKKIIVCIPVYNDWAPLSMLIHMVAVILENNGIKADLLIVDDGSIDSSSEDLGQIRWPCGVAEVLQLRNNMGHQRAIAVGLSFIHAQRDCHAVLIMDGDGEDMAESIPLLIEKFEACNCEKIVFAKRKKRTEGIIFNIFYFIYKTIHNLFTGLKIEVGNFSIIPEKYLDRLVITSEIWSHYAASVIKTRIPFEKVKIDRGVRLAGRSKMNFVSLVTHGLSAMSVYSEMIGVRMFILTTAITLLSLIGLISVTVIHLFTDLSIPAWTPFAVGILTVIMLLLILISFVFIFIILQGRQKFAFLPVRDYKYYILQVSRLGCND